MSEKVVSIIIPNYNGEDLLLKNLPNVIHASENSNNRVLEIIVVDDASSDKSVKIIKKNFPKVRVVIHKKNRGFSSTVNTGVRSCRGEYVSLLNSDVSPSHDFLVSSLKILERDNVFGVSFNEGKYGSSKGVFSDGFINHIPGTSSNHEESTFWVSGGSGLFKKTIWNQLGGLDQDLFSPFYWEDVDLSYRAIKRGYLTIWDPNSKVKHEHEGTIAKLSEVYVNRIQERNQLMFIWKNLTSKNLTRKHIAGLIKRCLKHPGYLRIVFMALSKIKLILKLRKIESKECKVSDEAIFGMFK